MKHCLRPSRTVSARVKALDDWYPCFDGNEVEVTFWPKSGRISVWGDDDFGMEKTGCTRRDYARLVASPISKDELKKKGFQQC